MFFKAVKRCECSLPDDQTVDAFKVDAGTLYRCDCKHEYELRKNGSPSESKYRWIRVGTHREMV